MVNKKFNDKIINNLEISTYMTPKDFVLKCDEVFDSNNEYDILNMLQIFIAIQAKNMMKFLTYYK
jgi:hypothetical protein